MHELAATRQIVRLASEAAQKNGAAKVTRIVLVIGDQSGYVRDSMRMYFDAVAKGTICQGCELEIHRVKTKLRCQRCKQLFERKPFSFECPSCGAQGFPTEIGNEFYIDTIEAIQGEDHGDQN